MRSILFRYRERERERERGERERRGRERGMIPYPHAIQNRLTLTLGIVQGYKQKKQQLQNSRVCSSVGGHEDREKKMDKGNRSADREEEKEGHGR
jgi:hypothetical protein